MKNNIRVVVVLSTFLTIHCSLPAMSSYARKRSLLNALTLHDHEFVDYMLDNKLVSPNAHVDGKVMLSHAAWARNPYAVNKLIKKGADTTLTINPNAGSPIFNAVHWRKDFDPHNAELANSVIKLLLNEKTINQRGFNTMTPLIISAITGNIEAVKILLDEKDIEIDAQDGDGDTACHIAARHAEKSRYYDILSLLIRRNCRTDIKNIKEQTPLDRAPIFARELFEKDVRSALALIMSPLDDDTK